MADDSVTKSSVSGHQAAARGCSAALRETSMSGNPAGLISFSYVAKLLGEKWEASKREICGWVMDGRLVPYTVEGTLVSVGGMFGQWIQEFATAQESKETGVAPDYLPAIERCHFVEKDVDEFDPTVLSAKVIELNQAMARRRADEEGNPRPLNIPTCRYVDGQWLLDRLQGAVSNPLDYLDGLIESGRFECAYHPVLDNGGLVTWLFDRESAERILREDFPRAAGAAVGEARTVDGSPKDSEVAKHYTKASLIKLLSSHVKDSSKLDGLFKNASKLPELKACQRPGRKWDVTGVIQYLGSHNHLKDECMSEVGKSIITKAVKSS